MVGGGRVPGVGLLVLDRLHRPPEPVGGRPDGPGDVVVVGFGAVGGRRDAVVQQAARGGPVVGVVLGLDVAATHPGLQHVLQEILQRLGVLDPHGVFLVGDLLLDEVDDGGEVVAHIRRPDVHEDQDPLDDVGELDVRSLEHEEAAGLEVLPDRRLPMVLTAVHDEWREDVPATQRETVSKENTDTHRRTTETAAAGAGNLLDRDQDGLLEVADDHLLHGQVGQDHAGRRHTEVLLVVVVVRVVVGGLDDVVALQLLELPPDRVEDAVLGPFGARTSPPCSCC